jgi:hypothetical protein
MPKQTENQRETVDRVMHEFKHGELKTAGGRKVVNPRQAVAIGLSEAGASNRQSPAENRRARAHPAQGGEGRDGGAGDGRPGRQDQDRTLRSGIP